MVLHITSKHTPAANMCNQQPEWILCVLQSLALANLFVWMEILFFFGYRQDLQAKLNARIEAERSQSKGTDQTAPLLSEQNKQ